jgi:hypothetical protein
MPEERWNLRIGQDGICIEPAMSSCRQYDCCLGTECGLSLAEAQAEVVAYYQRQADRWREMAPEQFVKAQGYQI